MWNELIIFLIYLIYLNISADSRTHGLFNQRETDMRVNNIHYDERVTRF